MIWVFTGYAATIYALFVVGAIVALPTHPGPQREALAMLVFLPCIAIACGSGVFIHGTGEDRRIVRAAFAQGLLKRWQAVCAGIIAASMAIAVLAGACSTSVFGTGSLYFLIVLGGLSLFLSPVGACAWLVARAKRLSVDNRGFPVIHAKPCEHGEGKS